MTKKRAALVAVFVLSWTTILVCSIQAAENEVASAATSETVHTASSALIAPETIPQQATSLDATGELEAPAPVPPATETPLPTPTPTWTDTPTPTQTATWTYTPTPTETPTETYTPTITCTFTPTPTFTATPTFTPTPTNTPTPMGLTYFLKQLVDLDRLAVLEEEGVISGQFSSYDRKSVYDAEKDEYVGWDANADHGQYLRVESATGEAVMAEIEGPGCIHRIWSANPTGKIRFYMDGDTTPTIEFDFNDLFNPEVSPIPRPFVWQRRLDLGGDNPASVCYMPFPFAQSCKVTADKPHNQYYHIGYTKFSEDCRVVTLRGSFSPDEEKEILRVGKILSNCGADPQPADWLKVVEDSVTLDPGNPVVLAELEGPATIRQFHAKLTAAERFARRNIVLKVYWDGSESPSVECPLGDFFGDAWDEAAYQSLPLGTAGGMNYCYWRMPFAKSALIVVTNEGILPATLEYEIDYVPGELPENHGYFHAKWRRDADSIEFDYPVLECTGRGRFVGTALFPNNLVGGWWGEGDEKIYVDGEKFPSTFGTGSEDYFGDAWGYRYFENAFHGCPTRLAYNETQRQSAYRWHIPDSIPFNRSFKITIENYAAKRRDLPRNDYSSVAYWYQEPGGGDFFESVPVEGRIPAGPQVPYSVDAEETLVVEGLPDGIEVVSDALLPQEAVNHQAVKISGPAGTRVAFDIPTAEEDKYTVQPFLAGGSGTSGIVLRENGKAIGEYLRLAEGKQRIEVVLTGESEGGGSPEVYLDCFVVEPYREFVCDWLLVGPFENSKKEDFDRVYPPEAEGFKLDATYDGLSGSMGWAKIHDDDGIINLRQYYDEDHAIAYAHCVVFSPDDREATMYLGSNDGAKLWLNGEEVHKSNPHRRLKVDDDRIEVSLRRGWNTVLLKVAQSGGDWEFAFRVKDINDELYFGTHIPRTAGEKAPPCLAPCQELLESVVGVVEEVLGCCLPCCP